MGTTIATSSPLRRLLPWIGLAAVAGLLALQSDRLTDPAVLGLHDYVAYWSAGRLNALGSNPYSPEQLLPVQQAVGWDEGWPNIMYYPPWALPVVMPFGLIPYGLSRLLWLILHLALVLFCADRTWHLYGGRPPYRWHKKGVWNPTSCAKGVESAQGQGSRHLFCAQPRYRWLACAVALTFVPTLIALRMGQIGPLMLLGVAGFLCLEQKQRDWLAGAALVLAAIKPQLLYLFGLAVVVWAVDRRRWAVLAGGVMAGLTALGVALAANPHVLEQYRYALANPPSGNITPTLGAMLRLLLGEDKTWLQFVPTVIGIAWFAWYWHRHRRNWVWVEQAPLLLMASFLTTSYGSWVFDLVILLVPVLQMARWAADSGQRRAMAVALASYVAIDGVALVMNLRGATYPSFIWMTPAILVCYVMARGLISPQPRLAPAR
jgi:hypothetical protein